MDRIAGALVATLGIVAAWPAAALTISGTYYEDTVEITCQANNGFCALNFAQFPASTAGKFVTIEEVGCNVFTQQAFNEMTLWITDAGDANTRRRPHPLSTTRSTGNASIGQQVTVKISGGPPRQPQITIRTGQTGNMDVTCTIVGTISTQ